MHNVVVIDDQRDFLSEIRAMLKQEFDVTICSSPVRGVRRVLKDKPDLVIVTFVMKEIDGFEVLRRLKSGGLQAPIVMISGYGDASTPSEATRLGAADYISRPIVADELRSRLKRAMSRAETVDQPLESLHDGICTADAEMLSMLELAHVAADTDSRILILGETGTGKELIAHAIHRYSKRAKQPFIEVNCAAIQPSLLESELFGHEKGAFTGAINTRQGKFELASGGTIFLDEIGEMSLEMQSKMLRVLQNGDFYRVGGNRRMTSSARIVAATNQNLRDLVDAGKFRADLYFRLNVVTLVLPPLRRRRVDVPLLSNYFLERFSQPGMPAMRFSQAAMRVLLDYHWPGNIRELEHLIERLSILTRKPTIDVADLPEYLTDAQPDNAQAFDQQQLLPYREARTAFDRDYFTRVLNHAEGNMAKAARLAGIDRSQFFRMNKKLSQG